MMNIAPNQYIGNTESMLLRYPQAVLPPGGIHLDTISASAGKDRAQTVSAGKA